MQKSEHKAIDLQPDIVELIARNAAKSSLDSMEMPEFDGIARSFRQFKYAVKSELYRHTGSLTARSFCKQLLVGEGFRYMFWMRACQWLGSHAASRLLFYWPAYLVLRKLRYKLGIVISPQMKVGFGFYIGHFGGIVLNERAAIGSNCNLSHGVTLGQVNRGPKRGYPTIGDNVYIGPGAKIVGNIHIGNNVAIGANCVVTNDIPDNSVVVGIPGRVVSDEGSLGYVNRTDYPRLISY